MNFNFKRRYVPLEIKNLKTHNYFGMPFSTSKYGGTVKFVNIYVFILMMRCPRTDKLPSMNKGLTSLQRDTLHDLGESAASQRGMVKPN